MVITKIEKTGKYRYAIWADDTLLLSVTSAQMALLDIQEDDVLEGAREEAFVCETRRMAARAAMDLLMRRDHAEAELRRKLLRKGFSEELAEYGLAYVRKYHYTDDVRYAARRIQCLEGTCSYRVMKMKLQEKGISSESMEAAMASCEWDDKDGIRREIYKKYDGKMSQLQTDQALQTKCIQALQRKGYHFCDIREVLCECLTMA